MREMIEEPAITPASLLERRQRKRLGTNAGIAYFRAMRAMIRQLDPDRFVSFADDNCPSSNARSNRRPTTRIS